MDYDKSIRSEAHWTISSYGTNMTEVSINTFHPYNVAQITRSKETLFNIVDPCHHPPISALPPF